MWLLNQICCVLLFQVLVNGNINTYLMKELTPSTEYEILLAAIYGNEVESDEVILMQSTGKFIVKKTHTFPHTFKYIALAVLLRSLLRLFVFCLLSFSDFHI